MKLENLATWINNATANGAVPVITGRNGDMDTIGSAIALASSHPNLMACGLHLGKLANRLCTELNAPFRKLTKSPTWPTKMGGIIIVDAASEAQTGLSLPHGIPICVIDHHDTCEWNFAEHDLEFRNNARATTQIIFEYLNNHSPEALSDEVRKLLLAGLITDTGRFKHADRDALKCASEILEGANFEYQEFVEHIQTEEINSSERGAILKALSRCQSTECGKWNLIHTHAGIHEGKVAGLLIQAGAEIALVSRYRDGETRLTARATRFSTKHGIHLGEMMKDLSEKMGGEGGGHDGAAGWSGKSDRIAAESAFINLLASKPRDEYEP
jgi:nanoRNase/pAp phosphatase (c-di-AMP/oligoRNAs hydrolase)